MKKLLLAHDLGTTGNKATLFSADGTMLASVTRAYGVHYEGANIAEQNPEDWWAAVCESTRELLQGYDPKAVAGVSFSGQMMGCVCVDKQGRLLRQAIIWADTRSTDQEKQLREGLDPFEFYRITGHRPSASYSLAKLMWIRDHEPHIFREIHKVIHAKDYIVLRLTDRFVSEYSDASRTNAFDIMQFGWSEQILEVAQIDPALFPDLYPSTQVAGTVTSRAAAATGLAEGTPVVIGGGDGLCASVGAGSLADNEAYNYLGSSSWISVTTKEPIFDPEMRTFNWVHIIPGFYHPTGTMQAAGNSMQYAKELFGHQQKAEAEKLGVSPYSLIDQLAGQSTIGAGGLLFLPYLLGERSPWWNPAARGALLGLSMSHKQSDVFRAVEEGILLNLGLILDILRQQCDIKSINIIGGLAKGETVRRLAADIYGVEICKLSCLEEATSLGAAVTAGVGVGLFKDFEAARDFFKVEERLRPNPEATRKYTEIKKAYIAAYHALKPVFADLAKREL